MTRFIVFEPPSPSTSGGTGETGGTGGAPSDRARFVRDAFAGWAILVPFLWLFRHGLVVSGAAVLVLWLGLGALGRVPGLGLAGNALALLLGVLVALEGPSLRAARLRRRQWREAAVVEADDEEEAAILYYAGALPPQPEPAAFSKAADARGRALTSPARSLLDPPRAR